MLLSCSIENSIEALHMSRTKNLEPSDWDLNPVLYLLRPGTWTKLWPFSFLVSTQQIMSNPSSLLGQFKNSWTIWSTLCELYLLEKCLIHLRCYTLVTCTMNFPILHLGQEKGQAVWLGTKSGLVSAVSPPCSTQELLAESCLFSSTQIFMTGFERSVQ